MIKYKKSEIIKGLSYNWLAILISIFIFFDSNQPIYFNLLGLMPLTYGLLSFFIFFIYTDKVNDNFFVFLFRFLMYISYVISPLFLVLGNYNVKMTLNISQNMPHAILLSIYNLICMFLVILFLQNVKSKRKIIKIEDKNIEENNLKKGKIISLIFIFLIVVCILIVPGILTSIRTVFGILDENFTGLDWRNIIDLYAVSDFKKFFMVIYHYLINIAKIFIPTILILKINGCNFSKFFKTIMVGVVIFISNFLLMDDTIAQTIYFCLILFIIYTDLIKDKILKETCFFMAGLLVGCYFLIRLSFYQGNPFDYLSSTLQAYFSGVGNVSAGFNLNDVDFFEKMKIAIYEVLKGVPFANSIFNLDGTNIAKDFNNVNGIVGQIVPSLTSSWYYFGDFLAPLIPCFFTLLGYKIGSKIIKSQDVIYKLSGFLACLYFALGISMYSPEITYANVICVALPIFIFSKIRFKGKVKNENITSKLCL